MPGVNGLSGVNGMPGVSGLSGGAECPERADYPKGGRNALRGRLDTSMPIAWIIGPAAHLFHAAMKLFEPLGF